MPSFFYFLVNRMTNLLPNRKSVRFNNHRASYWTIIDKIGLLNDICIPLAKIVFHRRNFFNKLFMTHQHTPLILFFHKTQKTSDPKRDQGLVEQTLFTVFN